MARVMGLSGYGCQLNRSMQHFNQVIRQYFPLRRLICPAVLNQTPARMVFRLNQCSRTALSGS